MKLIEQDNGQALVLLKKINRLKSKEQQIEVEILNSPLSIKLRKIQVQIENLESKLPKFCTHNKTKRVNSYESGSYLDRAKYIHTTVCDICGEELCQDITLDEYG